MSENIITSSPSKFNKSLHNVRLSRRTKRKLMDFEQDKVQTENFLSGFYNDSDEESSVEGRNIYNSTFIIANPTSIVHNYKPFQLEMSLLVADNVMANECRRPLSISESQGFYTCQRLAENEGNFTNTKDKNGSFTITESELISCCNQAEKNLCKVSPEQDESSPSKLLANNMSLVNSILEDFSLSPFKEQITNTTSWQYTPEFRLRRLPIKTYSRKLLNKTRTNLSKHFSNQPPVSLLDEHETYSNCSSLSVQEDVDFMDTLSSPPVSVSNTSQHLCENLVNLSAYFTQNSTSITHYTDNAEKNNSNESINLTELLPTNRMPGLIQELVNLRANYIDCNGSYNSLEDFCGFYKSSDSDKVVSDCEDESDQTGHNSIDITIRPNESQNISINFEDNDSLANWNKDNCEEIFACINTEEIIRIQNKFKISKESNNLENIQDKKNVNNCDIRTLVGDENLFDNPKDDELNDDCDIFLNFQTPIDLKKMSNSELVQSNEDTSKRFHQTKENIISSAAKICDIGFKTASCKNIAISKKAQKSVQNLLNEFNKELAEDLICNELKETKYKIYNRNRKQNEKISENNTTTEKTYNAEPKIDKNNIDNVNCIPNIEKQTKGFNTANGKEIMVSAKAKESVKNLLSTFFVDEEQNIDTDILLTKQQITSKNHKLSDLKSTTSTMFSSTLKKDELNVLSVQTKSTNIPISNGIEVDDIDINKDQSKTCNLRKDHFCKNNADYENLKSEWPISSYNESSNTSTMKRNLKELNNCASLGGSLKTNIGFQTANGKKVSISGNAQRAVEKLLSEVDIDLDATNIENNLKNIKIDMLNKNKQLEKANINIKSLQSQIIPNNVHGKLSETSSLDQKENPIESNLIKQCIKTNLHISEKNHGFQTANGKNVSISAKAQKAVQNFLQEFETDMDYKDYESNLKELKTNIKNKNKPNVDCLKQRHCSQEINEYSKIMLSEWPLSETESNSTPVVRNCKRKHSFNNEDIAKIEKCSSPPAKILNKGLPNTRSTFAELSLKSPLTPAQHLVISGKNLLSLTKRKKSNRNHKLNVCEEISKNNQETVEDIMNIATPIKTTNNLIDLEKTPVTPNIQEFFTNAPHTSTPRSNNSLCKTSQTINESDFKPIKWNNNNNETSINTSQTHPTDSTKVSESSFSNITLNSSNPTAKERIGRLKMYGKAPAVSPILIDTHNNCRPSGLRRTRSMFKKTEHS